LASISLLSSFHHLPSIPNSAILSSPWQLPSASRYYILSKDEKQNLISKGLLICTGQLNKGESCPFCSLDGNERIEPILSGILSFFGDLMQIFMTRFHLFSRKVQPADPPLIDPECENEEPEHKT